MVSTIYVYSDGSAYARDKTGGWAFAVTDNKDGNRTLYKANGGTTATTVNRMELTAAINSLHYVFHNHQEIKRLIIFSDSKYVTEPVYFGWVDNWRNSDWVGSTGNPVANPDLWEEVYQLLKRYRRRGIAVDFCWVKGHAGNHFNELCDRMAKEGREKQIQHKWFPEPHTHIDNFIPNGFKKLHAAI